MLTIEESIKKYPYKSSNFSDSLFVKLTVPTIYADEVFEYLPHHFKDTNSPYCNQTEVSNELTQFKISNMEYHELENWFSDIDREGIPSIMETTCSGVTVTTHTYIIEETKFKCGFKVTASQYSNIYLIQYAETLHKFRDAPHTNAYKKALEGLLKGKPELASPFTEFAMNFRRKRKVMEMLK